MSSIQRNWRFQSDVWRKAASGAGFVVAVAALAGCSADVARLDSPGFGLTDSNSRPSATRANDSQPVRRYGAGGPVEDTSQGWPSSGPRNGSAGYPPPAAPGVRVTNLPDAATPPASPPPRGFTAAPAARPAALVAPAQKRPIAAGQTIDVQSGDTLYGFSKRYNVSIAALMELNNLQNPNLKPGQKIVLPRGAKAPFAKPQTRVAAPGPTPVGAPAPARAAIAPVAAQAAPAVVAAAPPVPSVAVAAWAGSYQIKPGESLYGIARAHHVSLNDLQAANAIADVNKVRPGMALKVPAGVVLPAAAAEAPVTPATTEPATPRVVQKAATKVTAEAAPAARPGAFAPKIINGGPKPEAAFDPPADEPAAAAVPAAKPIRTASVVPMAPAAAPATGTAKLRWPVKGQVVGTFGKRPDGTHNDGVNVAVPAGTDVHAAEAGSVAYAGSELKGYGNLVLVRHDNGLVTAYAHNDQLLVKRGDAVKRGQVIAKAGKSGAVDQPQLHFELRQGSKPVDPTPYMEKM